MIYFAKNNNMRKLAILSLFLLLIAGCKSKQTAKEKQRELQTGTLNEKNIYTAKEIGWTIQLPDWDVITKKENEKLNQKGKEALEKSVGAQINTSGLIELINIKKDPFNSFTSTIEAYNVATDGSYAEHNKMINEVVKNAYASKNIYAEYAEDTAIIDGLTFNVFSSKIYSPDKTKVILFQKLFSGLINGYDFGMSMNYNNDADMKTLESAIYSSKFSKNN
jgi:hypothetical protein